MCQGIVRQAQSDARGVMSLEFGEVIASGDETNSLDNVEHEVEDWRTYWDDMSGEPLDAKLASEARAEEIREIHRMRVYVKVSLEECLRETGKAPVGTRWVDVNKGDAENPKVRCRLVAQEVAVTKQPELFAATPPIEYIRYLASCVASSQWGSRPTRLMIQDVKKAYFYAPATRKVYVRLPEEDRGPGEEKMCGRLQKSFYGTRDAAHNWAMAYTAVLDKLGFEKGATSPCTFLHRKRGIKMAVHGDDFVSEGPKEDLVWFNEALSKEFEIKTEMLGPDEGEVQEVRVLNRVIRW